MYACKRCSLWHTAQTDGFPSRITALSRWLQSLKGRLLQQGCDTVYQVLGLPSFCLEGLVIHVTYMSQTRQAMPTCLVVQFQSPSANPHPNPKCYYCRCLAAGRFGRCSGDQCGVRWAAAVLPQLLQWHCGPVPSAQGDFCQRKEKKSI